MRNQYPVHLVPYLFAFLFVLASVGCAKEPVGVVLTYQIGGGGAGGNLPGKTNMLVAKVNHRLGGIGRATASNNNTLVVELYGTPMGEDLACIKQLISSVGYLEFRILADPNQTKDVQIIKSANALPPNKTEVEIDSKKVAEWVECDAVEFKELSSDLSAVVTQSSQWS